MYTIRKKFKFEAAHQLASSFSDLCHENLHGHSYVLEVFLQGKTLNKDGMLMDFGELKHLTSPLLEQFDHALMLPSSFRTDADTLVSNDLGTNLLIQNRRQLFDAAKKTTKHFFEWEGNPTAESMAKYFFDKINDAVEIATDKRVTVAKVRVHETETGWAEYTPDED